MNDGRDDYSRQLSEHAKRISALENELVVTRAIAVKLAAMTVDVMTALDDEDSSRTKKAFKDIKKTLNLLKLYATHERGVGDGQFLNEGEDGK